MLLGTTPTGFWAYWASLRSLNSPASWRSTATRAGTAGGCSFCTIATSSGRARGRTAIMVRLQGEKVSGQERPFRAARSGEKRWTGALGSATATRPGQFAPAIGENEQGAGGDRDG